MNPGPSDPCAKALPLRYANESQAGKKCLVVQGNTKLIYYMEVPKIFSPSGFYLYSAVVELPRRDLKVLGSNPGETWTQKNSTVEDFNFAFF